MSARPKYLKFRYNKLRKRIVYALCSRLYRDNDGDVGRSIMVAGTARSGTTWLADIVASHGSCRIMFEPFHPKKIKALRQFHYFQYMRPIEQNSELQSYCRAVFTGEIRDSWIDRRVDQILPKYRLVKEIRANLFLRWIHIRFAEVPLLFIVRHPCAVVLSRMQLDWATDTDIEVFLAQPKLVEDFLANKMEVIRRAKMVEEKHAIIWCVSHLVPLEQFGTDGLDVIFYENLCTQPEDEIARVFQAINWDDQALVFNDIDKPSSTTIRTSAIVTGEDKVTRWKKELTPKQISKILSVVQDFGLDYIYGDSVAPQVEAL